MNDEAGTGGFKDGTHTRKSMKERYGRVSSSTETTSTWTSFFRFYSHGFGSVEAAWRDFYSGSTQGIFIHDRHALMTVAGCYGNESFKFTRHI